MNIKQYINNIDIAIKAFWDIRSAQKSSQNKSLTKTEGNRGAVTGGKQLDGFISLIETLCLDAGIPKDWIYTKNNHIPGYFRATKDWDLLIISPKKQLIAAIELKSQVGSFGNNFNNRSEEAIGSACDFWTAFRENVYPNFPAPWLGYLIIVEKSEKSTSTVRVSKPHFDVMPEFEKTTYLDRYAILCRRLITERLYTSCATVWTSRENYSWGDITSELSITSFLMNLSAHLQTIAAITKQK
ncbi:MAG: PaeR7I family type II restriction endonuclease [Rikenellaceae bacterium]